MDINYQDIKTYPINLAGAGVADVVPAADVTGQKWGVLFIQLANSAANTAIFYSEATEIGRCRLPATNGVGDSGPTPLGGGDTFILNARTVGDRFRIDPGGGTLSGHAQVVFLKRG